MSAKKSTGTKRKYANRSRDWRELAGEYITGEMGLRALAEQHGILLRTMGLHAVHEQWVAQRERYRHAISTELAKNAAAREITAREQAILTCRSVIERWSNGVEPPSASEALKALDLWLSLEGDKPPEQVEHTFKLLTADDLAKARNEVVKWEQDTFAKQAAAESAIRDACVPTAEQILGMVPGSAEEVQSE